MYPVCLLFYLLPILLVEWWQVFRTSCNHAGIYSQSQWRIYLTISKERIIKRCILIDQKCIWTDALLNVHFQFIEQPFLCLNECGTSSAVFSERWNWNDGISKIIRKLNNLENLSFFVYWEFYGWVSYHLWISSSLKIQLQMVSWKKVH